MAQHSSKIVVWGQMNTIALCASMYFKVEQGPNKNSLQTRFGPRAAKRRPEVSGWTQQIASSIGRNDSFMLNKQWFFYSVLKAYLKVFWWMSVLVDNPQTPW